METTIVGILARDLAMMSTAMDSGFLGNSVVIIAEKSARKMVRGIAINVMIAEPTRDGAIPPISLDSGVGGVLVKKSIPALRITGMPLLSVTMTMWIIGVIASRDKAMINARNNLSFIFLQLYNYLPPPLNDY
ncbi:MAG: hypothetical protein QW369_00895 [Desulfurococcaceae archaeon]